MSRPIIFRGKAINRKDTWFYGSLRQYQGEYWVLPFDEHPGIDKHKVDPKTVGQKWSLNQRTNCYTDDLFMGICTPTGMEKDGKKRLAKITKSNWGMTITVWHEGEWWGFGYADLSSFELVGNIHDNTELIEG